MITKKEALELSVGRELHCTVAQDCAVDDVTVVRVLGPCQTTEEFCGPWLQFRLPVGYRWSDKAGDMEVVSVTDSNCEQYHLPDDCPALHTPNSNNRGITAPQNKEDV
jgi:hypothetical protein